MRRRNKVGWQNTLTGLEGDIVGLIFLLSLNTTSTTPSLPPLIHLPTGLLSLLRSLILYFNTPLLSFPSFAGTFLHHYLYLFIIILFFFQEKKCLFHHFIMWVCWIFSCIHVCVYVIAVLGSCLIPNFIAWGFRVSAVMYIHMWLHW